MTIHTFICVQLDDADHTADAAVAELRALFPNTSADVIKDTLNANGGIASVAASRLIQWPGKVHVGVRIVPVSMLKEAQTI